MSLRCVLIVTAYNGQEDTALQVDQLNVEESQQDDQGLVDEGSQTEEQDPSTHPSGVGHQVRCVRKPTGSIISIDDVLIFITNAIHSVHCDSCHRHTNHCQHL